MLNPSRGHRGVDGVINMIRPDGTSPRRGFTGEAHRHSVGPEHRWQRRCLDRQYWARTVALMAGVDTKGHPAGTKTGDVIHVFQSGSIQMLTDVSIDPAGNVWAANNWNHPKRRVQSRSPHFDLGRRFGPHRHLWRRGPGEAAAHGQGANVLTSEKLEDTRWHSAVHRMDTYRFRAATAAGGLAACLFPQPVLQLVFGTRVMTA